MKRPKLPKKPTLEQCIRWVMYAQQCSEEQARERITVAINSGRLPFEANQIDRDGKFVKRGVFRVRDGRVVEEH
jgi:hypothetical protein